MIRDLDGNVIPVDANQAAMMERMAKTTWVESLSGDLSVQTVPNGSFYIPSSELLDPEKEKAKLNAEVKRLEGELKRSAGILSNAGFLAKAPKEKVELEQKKQADYEKQLALVKERLAALNS
jgi:valyl-tRNA synthetase